MEGNRRSARSTASKVNESTAPVTGPPVQTQGNVVPVDSFQQFVIDKLTSLETLPSRITAIHETLERIGQENTDLKNAIEYATEQVTTLTGTVTKQAEEIKHLSVQLSMERHGREALANTLRELTKRNLTNEVYSRKSNLVLEGLAEAENENLERKVINCLDDQFHIKAKATDFDKIHRFGRSFGGRPRPVIIKFVTHSARDSVLFAARDLRNKPPNLFINEDLPSEVKSQRSDLRAVSIQARQAGARTVKLAGDKLTINNRVYTYDTINSVPPIYSLEQARTVKVNDDTTAFYSKHSFLSNFYPAVFTVDNIRYNSVEQMFVRMKLEAAGRTDLIPTLMQEDDCLRMKRLGDSVSVPRDSDWDQKKDNIMQKAVLTKFQQNEQLMQKLKATEGRTLVEASWGDSYWGAGVGLTSANLKRNAWSGQNKLGQILMNVRDN